MEEKDYPAEPYSIPDAQTESNKMVWKVQSGFIAMSQTLGEWLEGRGLAGTVSWSVSMWGL